MQTVITPENFEKIGASLGSIVSNVQQSEEGLMIIARIYDDVINLAESGSITVTNTVRISCFSFIIIYHDSALQFTNNTVSVVSGLTEWEEDVVNTQSSQ